MADLYADENFPKAVVAALRQHGHDVLTAHDAGQANQRIPDEQVLAFAIARSRAVVTLNYRHFVRLHKQAASHHGIVVCTYDPDQAALAQRIDSAVTAESSLTNKLIRVRKLP